MQKILMLGFDVEVLKKKLKPFDQKNMWSKLFQWMCLSCLNKVQGTIY